jgi:fidgetin-like protein 1
VKKIENEILESGETITFNEIAGLEDAKQTVYESVCWPMQRPDIYTGLRKAPTGVLLYGPPGKSVKEAAIGGLNEEMSFSQFSFIIFP